MPLTVAFKETIQARVRRDAKFRRELLREGVEELVLGEMDVGKALLRDYINATLGFERLGKLTGKSAKSLMRMFGPNGNPEASNLFGVLRCLRKNENIELAVRTMKSASRTSG